MGRSFFDATDAARQTFVEANRILGFDLAAVCFHGPAERLNQTDVSQPALFVCGMAAVEIMRITQPELESAVSAAAAPEPR